jgi:predicted protein tyrosine phosphatase
MIGWELARHGIYRITDLIHVGQYPKGEVFQQLRTLGIGTILNVAGGEYSEPGFTVFNVPVVDLAEMPLAVADRIVAIVTHAVARGERIFVHCIAGQNRSPGAVYISLLALGMGESEAAHLIEDSTLDAVARHEQIITARVVRHVLERRQS